MSAVMPPELRYPRVVQGGGKPPSRVLDLEHSISILRDRIPCLQLGKRCQYLLVHRDRTAAIVLRPAQADLPPLKVHRIPAHLVLFCQTHSRTQADRQFREVLRAMFGDDCTQPRFLLICQPADTTVLLMTLPDQPGRVAGHLPVTESLPVDQAEQRPVSV